MFIQLSQDCQHLKIRYDTANAFKTKQFDAGMAALDIQMNVEAFKQPGQIKEIPYHKQHPYQIVQKQSNIFDDKLAIQMIRQTFKHLFQLQSYVYQNQP